MKHGGQDPLNLVERKQRPNTRSAKDLVKSVAGGKDKNSEETVGIDVGVEESWGS